MHPLRLLFISILLMLTLGADAKELQIASMTATHDVMSVASQRNDLNGNPCALINVMLPMPGCEFAGNIIGNVEFKVNKYLVYLSPNSKFLQIDCPGYYTKRIAFSDYGIDHVESRRIYNLVVTVPDGVPQEPYRSKSSYLVIGSTPTGADVYINDEWAGNTPFNKKYSEGERLRYRVSKPLYHDETGEIVLDRTRCERSVVLRPAYGAIQVTSTPAGATVMLDNESQSRGKTPLTIQEVPSGQHHVRVQLPRYGPQVVNVTVADGATATADARLTASFAKLTVNSLPGATITADGTVRGTGTATWEQDAGLCDIEVSLAGHRPQSLQVEVVAGQPQTIPLELTPIYGSLAVESDPMGADIYIDGEKRGITPDVIDRVLAVEHSVRLSKAGCSDYTTTVTVLEGEEAQVSGKLPTGETVTISTGATGDAVYIDGHRVGTTPLTQTLPYGSHTAYAERGGKRTPEKPFEVRTGQPATVTLSFGEPVEFKVKGVKFRMVPIEGGTFEMGATGKLADNADSDEKPVHKVTVSDYMLGETEVTQELWKAVMGSNPSRFEGDDLPVEQVSWEDCQEFIRKLNSLTGKNFRLPTEAEWEYAAKGGNKAHGYKYSGSDDIDAVAWWEDNSGGKTQSVGTKQPNELGLYDMSGNVWEWCSDWYGSYSSGSQTNPTGPSSGSSRVNRGGSWNINAKYCRVSNRDDNTPTNRLSSLGLRLALPAVP